MNALQTYLGEAPLWLIWTAKGGSSRQGLGLRSSCLLHALVHIPMHPDSCSQVHTQRRRSARRLTGDGTYASWYVHLRSQNVPLYPCRLVRD